MVSVIANWIYILVTTYIIGFVILRNMAEVAYLYSKKGTKKAVYRFKLKGSNFLAGIVAATVYAEVFSIIYKVGLIANLFLILICVAFAYQFREDLAEHLKTVFGAMDRLEFLLYLFVIGAKPERACNAGHKNRASLPVPIIETGERLGKLILLLFSWGHI